MRIQYTEFKSEVETLRTQTEIGITEECTQLTRLINAKLLTIETEADISVRQLQKLVALDDTIFAMVATNQASEADEDLQ